jgi:hypothetical protein
MSFGQTTAKAVREIKQIHSNQASQVLPVGYQPRFPAQSPEYASYVPAFEYNGDKSIEERSRLLHPIEQEG